MKYAYVLIYSNAFGTRDDVADHLDGMPEILNWRYEMPNSFFLVSSLRDADVIARKLMRKGIKGASLLVTEYTGNSQGLLTEGSWSLLNEKRTTRPLEFGGSREKKI